jgi:hypothetical protein
MHICSPTVDVERQRNLLRFVHPDFCLRRMDYPSSLLIPQPCQPYTGAKSDIMGLWCYLQTIQSEIMSHFLTGNLPQLLLSKEYGANEFHWQEKYGPVYSIKGCFGVRPSHFRSHFSALIIWQESRLMVSDPVAVKYIINSPISVLGPSVQRAMIFLAGHGNILGTEGLI